MALAIVQHPETSVGQKAGAGLYIAGETIAHGALAVGTAGVACGLLAPCAATAETLLGIGTAACADGDCTNEVTAASNTAQSIWNLSPFNRGLEVERLLGGNLVRNNPVIDFWNRATGVARSIKSINLNAPTYQTLSRLTGTVQRYINSLANWSGNQNWAGVRIQSEWVKARERLLAIPPSATQDQLNALYQLQYSALEQGVVLTLVTVP